MSSIFSKRKKPLSEKDQKLINNAYKGDLQEVCGALQAGANVNAQRNDGITALLMASLEGHVEVVRVLLQHDNVEVNAKLDNGSTALSVASQNGHLEVVLELIKHDNVDVNAQYTDGATALFMASQNGHVEIVRKLLQHNKVEVNAHLRNGSTSLYVASQNGHLEIVRDLLQHSNVDVNAKRNDGLSALYMASQNGHVKVVRELLQHRNVDANAKRNDGITSLYIASQNGHVQVVRELLEHSNLDVNAQFTNGSTALYAASQNGHVQVVRELLQRNNVEVNARRDTGATPLVIACENGHVHVIRELLRNSHVDVNAQCNDGSTALYIASKKGAVEIVRELLLHEKVDVNAKADDGKSALFASSQNGFVEIVHKLLQHKNLVVNGALDNGATALSIATKNGFVEVVRKLLQHNAVDVNAKLDDGATALIIACHKGQVEAAHFLLQHRKVDVNAQLADGSTALYIASERGHVEIVSKLLQHNELDANIRFIDGATALLVASQNGHVEVVRKLLQHRMVDVNARRDTGATAVVMACQNGHLGVVRELLQHNNVDVNAQFDNGPTALVIASQSGNLEIVRDLLQHSNVDVNAHHSNGATSVFMASQNGYVDVVRELLQHGNVDVNAKIDNGATALVAASDNGFVEIVLALLQDNTVDVNAQGYDGATALFIASDKGHTEVVRALLQRTDVDVNILCSARTTALYIASEKGHVEIVRELLAHSKVEVNAKLGDGSTALYVACQNGHGEVVHMLLQRINVDVNAQCHDGTTALIVASEKGHVEIVRELLQQDQVDVNAQYTNGATALYIASRNGNMEVVRKLLQHNEVDLNVKCNSGSTALSVARANRHAGVVRLLEEHSELLSALEEMRHRQELLNRRPTGSGERLRGAASDHQPPRRTELSPPRDDAETEQDRTKLLNVMTSTSNDHNPVELSYQYIQQCITDRKLGSGAFGDVFFAEDSLLPKKFAVKKIKLIQCDEEIINKIRKSFQRELSTLKRFHHPNIIVLYGYNLNTSVTDQFLVYEYAANGSLDGFLRDDGNRARLPADTRLSIMFEVARAVHFLHTGGCAGWKVLHRDIKTANICLAEDYTARLIDCGLAKFVPDEDSNIIPGALTLSVRSTSGGPAFGTPGYMCPEYSRKKFEGIPCPYIASFDVFSIGVVMVELILGCLTGGQSSRNGLQFENAFRRYVKDDDDERIDDGWKMLMDDADPSIIWNPASLEQVCKAAIRCMAPTSKTRLTTSELLDELSAAVTEVRSHLLSSVEGEILPSCDICNRYSTNIKCGKGHALCASCIGNALNHRGGFQLSCLFKGCSSQPFQDKDLFGRIPVDIYNRYIEKRTDQTKLDLCLREIYAIRVGVKHTNDVLLEHQQLLLRLSKGLDRSLAAMSLLAANEFKECPNLVWATPISVEKKDLRNPRNWIKNPLMQKYSVVFICAYSGEPGHEPFEIEVPKGWISKIAPWLKLCLKALKGIANAQGLPFPIPDIPFFDQCEMMGAFLESVIEKGSSMLLSSCETLLENGTMNIDTFGQMQELAGDAFKVIAEKAKKEKRCQWKPPQMVPVCDRNGTIMWVKGEYQDAYRV